MTGENAGQRIVLAAVIVTALFGFFGCAKRGQVPPAPEEIELGGTGEGQPVPQVRGGQEGAITEESMSAQARQKLQDELEDIHFDFDKYNITPEARVILKKDYEVLQGAPEADVLVEGYCDNRGTVEYNLALGQRRANAARDYLITLGMDPARVSTVSYGEERPLDPRNTEEAWAKNRRCHFVILKR